MACSTYCFGGIVLSIGISPRWSRTRWGLHWLPFARPLMRLPLSLLLSLLSLAYSPLISCYSFPILELNASSIVFASPSRVVVSSKFSTMLTETWLSLPVTTCPYLYSSIYFSLCHSSNFLPQGMGESLTIVSTVFWTLHITYTDMATVYVDSISMMCIQLGVVTFLSCMAAVLVEVVSLFTTFLLVIWSITIF